MLELACSSCGVRNEPGERFCGDCGVALVSNPLSTSIASPKIVDPDIRLTAEQSDAALPPDGERKTVTALFADIKDSMSLMEHLDPEEARAIVDPALKLMIDAVHLSDGYLVQSTGDGVFALFGAPVSHEDHPQRALQSALRMQQDVKRYAEELRGKQGVDLQVRIGVNTGEVVVRTIKTDDSHTEYTPIGHSTSLAARLQAVANPGAIAISETLRKLVEGYFLLEARGPKQIKGVSLPLNVYEVMGAGPLRTRLQRSASRGYTKFVGRARELEALKAAAEQTRNGHGQIVAAIAEPGVGKSRLFFEFKQLTQADWTTLEASSVSHGKASAFLPAIDLLRSYFKLADDDDPRARGDKISGTVVALDPSLEDSLPYLLRLLGAVDRDDPVATMDSQLRKHRTHDAIKRILLRESLNQPLLIVFEDLHWIDTDTQAFLDLLADSIATAKVLLLVNYRPDYTHSWNSKTYYTQIRLDPLGNENGEELLGTLVGNGDDVAPLKRLIIEKTEGNPFFMEEMVQELFEDGALHRNGKVRLTRSLSQLKIPTTVQAIIASRIDRLPPRHKELLQTAAAIGRRFQISLLRAVLAVADDELDSILHQLQLAEFIYEQVTTDSLRYTFKHALTHEVAYNSILVERRRNLHERTGGAIESLFRSRIDEHYDELAYQYSRSGNSEKAAFYLRRSEEQRAHRKFDQLEDYLRELQMKKQKP
jgi:class 3 adenylate cyclase